MDKVELLKYIHKYNIKHGYSPSAREIGAHFKTYHITVSNICTELKKQGYLKDTRKKARALVLTEKALHEIGYLEPPNIYVFCNKPYVPLDEYQKLQKRSEKLQYATSLLRDIYICRKDPCLEALIDEAECYIEDVKNEIQ